MTTVQMQQHLHASADAVWQRIGGFGTLHEWHPAIAKTEMDGSGIGCTRNLFLADGGNVIERLDADDPAAYTYAYTILESPLPVRDYHATMRVEPKDDQSCTLHWSAHFEPEGAPEEQAIAVIEGIFSSAFAVAVSEFGG